MINTIVLSLKADDMSFANKISQSFSENRSSSAKPSTDLIKVLCFDNSTQFNNWLSGIRLAKFRERLKTSFKKLNSRKQEYGKENILSLK